MSTCRGYLEALSVMGAPVGDFYLKLGSPGVPVASEFKRGTPKHCYMNAGRLAQEHAELAYCEGFAVQPGLIAVHHAWCLTPDGGVVDVTWPFNPGTQYWGIALSTEFLLESLMKTEVWGILGEHVPREMLLVHPSTYLHPNFAPPRAQQDELFAYIKGLGIQP